jgi:hypothetical protein
MISRREEALRRLLAVIDVNKDRMPPEVTLAIVKALGQYVEAFGEDLIEQLRSEESGEDLIEQLRGTQELEDDRAR